MTDAERIAARAELIRGVSIQQLIEDLGNKNYRDLVIKHVQETGNNLSSIIIVHENLVSSEEADGVRHILSKEIERSSDPLFWTMDAGDYLSSVSCDLNDFLYPSPADEAGVFNLFQLITAHLAERARTDDSFHQIMSSSHNVSPTQTGNSSLITKMLGIAISDCDAGRISRRHLLSIFQDAIDNGDILEEDNEPYVVANVIPLVDAGLLKPSKHLEVYENQMNNMALDFLKTNRAKRDDKVSATRWWQFWK